MAKILMTEERDIRELIALLQVDALIVDLPLLRQVLEPDLFPPLWMTPSDAPEEQLEGWMTPSFAPEEQKEGSEEQLCFRTLECQAVEATPFQWSHLCSLKLPLFGKRNTKG